MRAKKSSLQTPFPKPSRPLMPGYGLPPDTRGLLPWKWAEDRLKRSHNYWVATGRPDGTPHLMIVWGMWLDGAFVFSTGRKSRKAKNLAVRRQCVIGTEQSDHAVIVEGVAEEAADLTFLRNFLRSYEKKYKFDMSSMERDILALREPIYIVRPRVVFALDEKKSLKAATRWRFT